MTLSFADLAREERSHDRCFLYGAFVKTDRLGCDRFHLLLFLRRSSCFLWGTLGPILTSNPGLAPGQIWHFLQKGCASIRSAQAKSLGKFLSRCATLVLARVKWPAQATKTYFRGLGRSSIVFAVFALDFGYFISLTGSFERGVSNVRFLIN